MAKRNVLSLEERIERMKKGKASSPEAAAAKFQFIKNMSFDKLLHSAEDIDLLFMKCGIVDYDGRPGVDIDHYYRFSGAYRMAFDDGCKGIDGSFLQTEKNVQFVNAMFLLASFFMDKYKEKSKHPDIYNALNMSLRDYWTAAADTCVEPNGTINRNRRRLVNRWEEMFMGNRNYDTSLKTELGSILNYFVVGWELFGKLHEVLACDHALSEYLEREDILNYMSDCDEYEEFNVEEMFECDESFHPEKIVSGSDALLSDRDAFSDPYEEQLNNNEEQLESCEVPLEETQEIEENIARSQIDEYNRYMDPVGYYLNKLSEFKAPVEDFLKDDVMYVRDEVMLDGDSYSPEDLKQMRMSIKNKCFLEEFDRIVESKEFKASYTILQVCALRIYYLLVLPFWGIARYHYDGPIED